MKKYQLLIVTVTYKPNVEELALFVKSFRKYNDLGDNVPVLLFYFPYLTSFHIILRIIFYKTLKNLF